MGDREQFTVGILDVKRAGAERAVIPLKAGETLRVGRVATNDMVLEDGLVSRFHAVFNASASGIVLSDLSSMNGTFVNQRRVTTPVGLRPGDLVTIGTTEIVVKAGALDDGRATESDSPGTVVAEMRVVVVTVLTADVCSYTRMSEEFPAQEVTAMLQTWFRRVSETVEEYGGMVDKYIGDCVMALWPGDRADAAAHAGRAGEAAVAIQERTNALSATGPWPYHDSRPWRCRISLNSGDALMGMLVGAGTRDFTVLGDTVNVAFRLNDLAGKVEKPIVLSAGTAALIEGEFALESLGPMPIEGRAHTVEMFHLIGRKAQFNAIQ